MLARILKPFRPRQAPSPVIDRPAAELSALLKALHGPPADLTPDELRIIRATRELTHDELFTLVMLTQE